MKLYVASVIGLLCICLCLLGGCDAEPSQPPAEETPPAISTTEPSEPVNDSSIETQQPTTAPELPEEPNSPEPVEVVKVRELPNPESLSYTETPLLYDFVHGCLDYHAPIRRDLIESEFYIMRHSSCPEVLHCDWYMIQEDYAMPPLGSRITSVEIDPEYLESIEPLIEKLPAERRLVEGDWELLLLTLYDEAGVCGFDDDGKWGEMTPRMFAVLQAYTDGLFKQEVNAGAGWPTEWLRREPYCEKMSVLPVLKLEDSWWDSWVFRKQYSIVREADGEVLGYVSTSQPEMFDVYSEEYSNNGAPLHLTYNEMWMTLVSENLILEGAPELKYQEESYDFD